VLNGQSQVIIGMGKNITLFMKMKKEKRKCNPVAKHLNDYHRPKRIEDKRYKEQLKQMDKDVREVRRMQKNIYES